MSDEVPIEERLLTCAKLIEAQVHRTDQWADEWRARMDTLSKADAPPETAQTRTEAAKAESDERMARIEQLAEQTQRRLDHLSIIVNRRPADPDAHT